MNKEVAYAGKGQSVKNLHQALYFITKCFSLKLGSKQWPPIFFNIVLKVLVKTVREEKTRVLAVERKK